MFRENKAFSSFSVNDAEKAFEFYSSTLGLDVKKETEGLEINLAGGGGIFIYAKSDHEPATFTVLNFMVQNIDETVNSLVGKGIEFEHFEGDIKTDEKGIFRGHGPTIAWFKDPAGNFISIIES